jgi:hypothetical protein
MEGMMEKKVMHVLLVLILWSLILVLPTAAAPPKGSITITSPNGGENWVQAHNYDITWSYTGQPGSTVKIVLIDEVTIGGITLPKITTIANNVPIGGLRKGKGGIHYGSYKWFIPSNQRPRSTYKIGIQSESQPTIRDVSDRYFRIKYFPKITVTSPNGGESWEKGSQHQITWDYSGNPPTTATVHIVLLHYINGGGIVDYDISTKYPIGNNGKGTFLWNIGPNDPIGKSKILIFSGDADSDMSDGPFFITTIA